MRAPCQICWRCATSSHRGLSDEKWFPIIRGIDLTLKRGEVMGLIGESGAGKSTLGIGLHGLHPPGLPHNLGLHRVRRPRAFWGIQGGAAQDPRRRIAYVAQSAAASFNPAHRLIKQYAEAPVQHGIMS
jgi:peptide/nickel transport system ATP-binding protein